MKLRLLRFPPELYDTKTYYLLIVPITKFELMKSLRTSLCEKVNSYVQSVVQTVEKQQKRTYVIDTQVAGVQLQVSNLKLFKLDTCYWMLD